MRYTLLLLVSCTLHAQTVDGDRVTQTLISEIQQLRMAIERSTLLNARTQLAISQFQLQEQSVARLTTQLSEVRARAAESGGMLKRLTQELQETEQRRTTISDPKMARELDDHIRDMKARLEQFTSMETARAAREGELSVQLQQTQSAIAASRARIEEMERALDTAIQQMLKR
jgi:chromosome segregation ATPase